MPDDAENKRRDAGADAGPRDRALIVGELPENKGLAVLRQRGEGAPVEAGVLRGVREGEPIVGELVSLTPSTEDARLLEVKVHVDARPPAHHGPARVSSHAYRAGWDALFAADDIVEPPTPDRRLN